jgi:hypothetical protein
MDRSLEHYQMQSDLAIGKMESDYPLTNIHITSHIIPNNPFDGRPGTTIS